MEENTTTMAYKSIFQGKRGMQVLGGLSLIALLTIGLYLALDVPPRGQEIASREDDDGLKTASTSTLSTYAANRNSEVRMVLHLARDDTEETTKLVKELRAHVETLEARVLGLLTESVQAQGENKVLVFKNDILQRHLHSLTQDDLQTTELVVAAAAEAVAKAHARTRRVLCKDPALASRPVFTFVVGAEGTGHHLVTSAIFNFPGVTSGPIEMEQLFAEIWEPTLNDDMKKEKIARLSGLLQEQANKLAKTMEVPGAQRPHLVIQRDGDMLSYPFDSPRNPLRRPDLLELVRLVEPLFDLKIIVTARNPLDSIASLIRRGWWGESHCKSEVPRPTRTGLFTESGLGGCSPIGVQARVVEDAMIYIESQLRSVSHDYFRVLRYEEMVARPADFAEPLATFLEVKVEDMTKSLRNVKGSSGDYGKTLTPIQLETIEGIFHPTKEVLWPYMEDRTMNLLTAPKVKEGEVCLPPPPKQ